MAGKALHLHSNGDGTYSEGDSDAAWTRTEYTEPREYLEKCVVCDQAIVDRELWLCLDGGETAHGRCSVIHV